MDSKKIVFLASDCESSRWVFHALKDEFRFDGVIIENPVSKKTLFRNRMKRTGFIRVMGQALFSLLAVPVLKWKARNRKAALIEQYRLKNTDFGETAVRINSVNDDACKELLQRLNPGIVLVNGTRILKKNILESTSAVFINMHVGITPMYRGSHGGYWAVHNKDLENFGTTIHLVDSGVDTGAVLKQVYARPSCKDNFTTYPIIQVAIGIDALKEVIRMVQQGNYNAVKHTSKGRMYYQPTIWQYLAGK